MTQLILDLKQRSHPMTDGLLQVLNSNDEFQAVKALVNKYNVIEKFENIFKQALIDVMGEPKNRENLRWQMFAHLSPANSLDIEAMCVSLHNAQNAEIIYRFCERLTKEDGLTELAPPTGMSKVRVCFNGLKIEVGIVGLPLNDWLSTRIMSLSGYPLVDTILKLVPNKQLFCWSYYAIKIWAMKRGLYSETLGYFGNSTLLILTAKICQLNPQATLPELIECFFRVFMNWPWPKPVLLSTPDNETQALNYKSNSDDIMPVLLPPMWFANTTATVTPNTFKVIVKEFGYGYSLMQKIMVNKLPWSSLFAETSIFHKYEHFIVFLITGDNGEELLQRQHIFEQRVRQLINVYLNPQPSISWSHFFPKVYDYQLQNHGNTANIQSQHCNMWFIGICFHNYVKWLKEEQLVLNNLKAGVRELNLYKEYEKWSLEVRYVNKKELSIYLTPHQQSPRAHLSIDMNSI